MTGEALADNGLDTTVRNAIAVFLAGEGSLSLAAVAVRLEIQPRTLQRRLARIDFTYQELVDQVRYGLARSLLESAEMPISEIASRLGYGDPAHFSRAFHRWAGACPSTYRDRLNGRSSGSSHRRRRQGFSEPAAGGGTRRG